MGQANRTFIGSHAADIVGVLLDEIAVEVDQLLPDLGGMFLIDTEHDGFGEAICTFEQVGQVFGHGAGA